MNDRAVFTVVADLPNELGAAWLHHIRAFDLRHPGCHFTMSGQIDTPTEEVISLFEKLNFDEILTIVRGDNDEAEEKDGT